MRAHALEGAAGLAWAQGEFERAFELAEAGRSLFDALGDTRGEQGCTTVLGHVALVREDYRAAETLYERTRQLAENFGEESVKGVQVALALHNLGSVALAQGDMDGASRRYEGALSLYAAENDIFGVALTELYLGVVAVESGR